MLLISIVIPAKNEQENIKPLVEEIVTALYGVAGFEIICVDDGSDDGTYNEIVKLSGQCLVALRGIKHEVSAGQSTAIYTGVTQARGELIVTLDADGQNNPADIPLLLSEALKIPSGADFCVAGFRKNRKDTPWKRLQSKVANRVRSYVLKDNTPDTGCGLKLFPRKTFLKLPYFDHMHRFLPALIKRVNGTIVVVEVDHRDREFGVSKYNMLGRLGVGLVDMLGVMWLQRRNKQTSIVETHD